MKKNVLSLALALVSVASLASCAGSTRPSYNNDELGYQYEDTTAPIVANPGTVSFNVTAPKDPLAKDYDDMEIIKDLEAQTNIHINWTHPSSYNLDLIMGSKDLPDAIYHASFSNSYLVQYGSQRHKLVQIDDYLQYMPNFSKILERRPDIKRQITVDGHIYALPWIEELGLQSRPNLLFINKQWLQKGIDEKKFDFIKSEDLKDGLKLTLDQFLKVMDYFKNGDPNGNGSADEIALDLQALNWQGNLSDLYAAYGAYFSPDFKTLINGKFVADMYTDEWAEATRNIKKNFFDTGYIPQAVFDQTQQQFLAAGKKEDQAMGSFYYWEKESVVKDPENYICMQPLVGIDGEQHINLNNNNEVKNGECVILSSCPNPEILLTYFDRYYEPWTGAQIDYGAIDEFFQDPGDSNTLVPDPNAIPEGQSADDFRLKNAPMGLMGLTEDVWTDSSEESFNGHKVEMEPRAKLRKQLLETCEKEEFIFPGQEVIPNLVYTTDETNQLKRYETNLNNKFKTVTYTYLYEEDLTDDAFNSLKSNLKSLGLDKVLELNQTAYDRMFGTAAE